MTVVPRMRRWWQHPAPYLAAALAFAIFLPVIGWNYHHNWASFAKQMGRVGIHGWGLRYVAEFAGSQVGLLTPFVFCLAAGGVWIALRSNKKRQRDAGLFLTALIAPMTLYFLFHSLHARVQGNWLAPAYPIFAVLGAQAAFHMTEFGKRLRSTISLSRRLAVPVGLCIVAIAYIQAVAAPIPLDPKKDPTALLTGWSSLARDIEQIARTADASYVLTSSYALTSELKVYMGDALPILQSDERQRWLSFERQSASVFYQRGLYVAERDSDKSLELERRFFAFHKFGEMTRRRNGRIITQYVIYLL